MKKQRKTYTKAFKLETIKLYESSGKSAAQIEQDLDLPRGMIHKWRRGLKQSEGPAFPGKGHQSEMEAELRRLKRENAILRQEREILKKAVVFFSKEQA
jgi:transposase